MWKDGKAPPASFGQHASFTELAKIHEIPFHERLLEMLQLSQFVTSIFKQDVVDVDGLTTSKSRMEENSSGADEMCVCGRWYNCKFRV